MAKKKSLKECTVKDCKLARDIMYIRTTLFEINKKFETIFTTNGKQDKDIVEMNTTIRERGGETKVIWKFIWAVLGSALLNTALVVTLFIFILGKVFRA